MKASRATSTLRDPVDPHTFWVNPFSVTFSLIKKRDLILVDHTGKVIDGGPCRLLNTAAYMIHKAIHKTSCVRRTATRFMGGHSARWGGN